ncbi:MAG TPA: oxidoreductase [Myxococcota bacterium]|nr:oxidoreductase [Myxococcota bacterium]
MAGARDKVWFVTGCSTGMGRDIAIAALEQGYRAVLTARNPDALAEIHARFPQRSAVARLDVTDRAQIDAAVRCAREVFGRIDVLVNNAGYGYISAIEEGDEAEVRAMFETNFWGLLAVTRAVLPEMRARRSGQIINNSSQAGLMSYPGTAYYSTSKFAVEAFSEGLSREVAPFGIRVTAVEAGPVRTDWAGRSMKWNPTHLADYAGVVGARVQMIADMDGKQPGDPARAAAAIVALAECENPPRQLLLGRGVLAAYRAKLAEVSASLDEWEGVTLGIDFPAA